MSKPRNVFIIVADSLRYDSVFKESKPGVPYMEQNAIQFNEARSSGCWTLPATSCMFTGLMPHQHGATCQSRWISDKVPTLAEKLKSAGYNTYQVTANIATTEVFGLHRGFDEVIKTWDIVEPKFKKLLRLALLIGKPRVRKLIMSKDDVMNKLSQDLKMGNTWAQLTYEDSFNRARKILKENQAKGKGSFFFINMMESHFPYHIAETFKFRTKSIMDRVEEARSLFHFLNQSFLKTEKEKVKPRFLKIIKERQQLSWQIIRQKLDDFVQEMHQDQENLVIFCADHGDNFGDMDWQYHFSNVTDGGNKVPLFWLGHDHHAAKESNTPISSRFMYNSILKACGIEDGGPDLFNEHSLNLPMLSSYWYNNQGKTMEKYKHDLMCFIDGDKRVKLKNNRWYTADITKNHIEPTFQKMPDKLDPIKEFVEDKERQQYLSNAIKDFTAFSKSIKN